MKNNNKESTVATSVKRGKTNGYKSAKMWAKREQKRTEAEARQEKYDALTYKEKLAKIASARGSSKRQLNKLTSSVKK